MGFNVSSYNDKDMEHDIILESDEGRIIGEVEGKDKTHIDISKFSQLSRVQDEDFYEKGEYSNAILIGNAYRLTEPEKRQNCFTDRVIKGAEKKQFGLLNTGELFKIIIKILENPKDEEFKKKCREKLFEQLGKEIKFD